jgi:hypothetical protein
MEIRFYSGPYGIYFKDTAERRVSLNVNIVYVFLRSAVDTSKKTW